MRRNAGCVTAQNGCVRKALAMLAVAVVPYMLDLVGGALASVACATKVSAMIVALVAKPT